MKRMWINNPSTAQTYHKYHGQNVLVDTNTNNDYCRVYFTSGSVISMEMHKNALSDGWKNYDSETNS